MRSVVRTGQERNRLPHRQKRPEAQCPENFSQASAQRMPLPLALTAASRTFLPFAAEASSTLRLRGVPKDGWSAVALCMHRSWHATPPALRGLSHSQQRGAALGEHIEPGPASQLAEGNPAARMGRHGSAREDELTADHASIVVSVRRDRSDRGDPGLIVPTVDSGHLKALHGGQERPKEAVVVGRRETVDL